MASRPIWLAKFRSTALQRAHFALFVPSDAYIEQDPNDRIKPCVGTLIHVVGLPMAGFRHEFKRNYDISQTTRLEKMVRIGWLESKLVYDPETQVVTVEDTARGQLDNEATKLPAPGKSKNFMAPVNNVTCLSRGMFHANTSFRLPIEDARNGPWTLSGAW